MMLMPLRDIRNFVDQSVLLLSDDEVSYLSPPCSNATVTTVAIDCGILGGCLCLTSVLNPEEALKVVCYVLDNFTPLPPPKTKGVLGGAEDARCVCQHPCTTTQEVATSIAVALAMYGYWKKVPVHTTVYTHFSPTPVGVTIMIPSIIDTKGNWECNIQLYVDEYCLYEGSPTNLTVIN